MYNSWKRWSLLWRLLVEETPDGLWVYYRYVICTCLWVFFYFIWVELDTFIMKLRTIFLVIEYIKFFHDMQEGMDSLNHCNEFLHILDFEKLFLKIVHALMVFKFLNKNIYLDLIHYKIDQVNSVVFNISYNL